MITEEKENEVDPSASGYKISPDDGIYLYDVWKSIAKRRNIIIAVFAIFLLGATIYYFAAPKIYRVETYIKIYVPQYPKDSKDIQVATKQPPTAKELATRLTRNAGELNEVIFPSNANDITKVKIEEVKGTADKLKVTIESGNRDVLSKAPRQLINYIENMPEIKVMINEIVSEGNEKLELVRSADKQNTFYLEEMEKKFNNTKVLPVNYNPIRLRQKAIDFRMAKLRLENELKNYKMIQLLEEPFVSKDPVRPQTRHIFMSGVVGLLLGVFVVLIMAYFEGLRKIASAKGAAA